VGGSSTVVVGGASVSVETVLSMPVSVVTPGASCASADKPVASDTPAPASNTVQNTAAGRIRMRAIAHPRVKKTVAGGDIEPHGSSHHQKDEQEPAF
jgi:hypothetical protein